MHGELMESFSIVVRPMDTMLYHLSFLRTEAGEVLQVRWESES
jgi:hypothetical protein